ncbi:hypothetical protein HPULCUR_011686 [Helicostylum pulchrum]|uniref:Uncharacterized protein n=1 Tax=Helicostylum pulchrum TaxID=562976 RepID=A0ABP9YGS2_9FUNG
MDVAADLMYLDNLEESVGAIIRSTARATDIVDRKTSYFKTLAMDQTIDMSDISQNSHLCLFSLLQQQQIIQKLSSPKIEARSACDMVAFENVIEKVRTKFNLYPELFD